MGPFGSDIKVSNFISEGVPVLSGANVNGERLKDEFKNYVSPAKANSLKKAVARRGDIVVTHRGTLGQISFIPEGSKYERHVISQSQFRARFKGDKANPAWVVLYFRSECGSAKLLEKKGHTGVPAIAQPTRTFRSLYIPLPTPAEQRAIAEALGDADGLIESLERLIAKKRAIKQGAMQELLTARRRLPGFKGEWETKRLGGLAKIQRGASPRPIDSPIWFDANSSVGWVRISDVSPSSMYLDDTSQKLSALGIQHSRPVAKGSLIMSICATVGRPVITAIDTCIHDGFVVFDSLQADIRFLYYLLKLLEDTWTKHGQTGSQMNLNTPLINGTMVAMPPTADEQTAIAAVLSGMDAEIAALEGKLGKARAIKQGMMQELLTGRIRLV